jgi:predicted MFS family arabinose efflux permease
MMSTKAEVNNIQLSSGLIFLLALAVGTIVANLYYAQTVVVLIGQHLNLDLQLTGLIITLIQIGYGVGLFFVVPLADIVENKRLIIGLILLSCIFLIPIIFTNIRIIFLFSCFCLGVSLVSVQILVPFVAHFVALEKRGKVVGQVMSGLLLGIMMARPLSSLFAYLFNWRAVFIFSFSLMLFIAFLLYCVLPLRVPTHKMSYKNLIYSLFTILKLYKVLQRRAIYHAALFGAFSLFWTAIAMLLTGDDYHYSQVKVALFALVGAAGALVAPIAGKIADSGRTKIATGVAIVMVGFACFLAKIGEHSIICLIVAALILDAGVACNLVLGQRSIYALAPEVRSRLNGLYMSIFFIGGAIGGGLSGYLYAKGGWSYVAITGLIVSILVFIYFISEYFVRNKE